jgi:hypothetical protein
VVKRHGDLVEGLVWTWRVIAAERHIRHPLGYER